MSAIAADPQSASQLEERLARLRARLASTPDSERALRVMLVLAHEALRRDDARLHPVEAKHLAEHQAPAAASLSRDGYAGLIQRVVSTVERAVPRDATLLVVSRGDDRLLVPGFDAGHFPQGRDGRYAGYYPADSDDALAQLGRLREAGVEFLVFPATAYWWLDFYGGLARHLLTSARVVHHDEHCLIFDLRAHEPGDATR